MSAIAERKTPAPAVPAYTVRSDSCSTARSSVDREVGHQLHLPRVPQVAPRRHGGAVDARVLRCRRRLWPSSANDGETATASPRWSRCRASPPRARRWWSGTARHLPGAEAGLVFFEVGRASQREDRLVVQAEVGHRPGAASWLSGRHRRTAPASESLGKPDESAIAVTAGAGQNLRPRPRLPPLVERTTPLSVPGEQRAVLGEARRGGQRLDAWLVTRRSSASRWCPAVVPA